MRVGKGVLVSLVALPVGAAAGYFLGRRTVGSGEMPAHGLTEDHQFYVCEKHGHVHLGPGRCPVDGEVLKHRRESGRLSTRADVDAAIMEGAVERVRPLLMTVGTTLIGLLPVMLGTQTGSQVMKRIASPMVGGMISATALTLVLLPVIYSFVENLALRRRDRARTASGETES